MRVRVKVAVLIAFLVLAVATVFSVVIHSQVTEVSLSNFTKLPSPVPTPSGVGLDAAATYNPAVVYVNGIFYMFYRAQAKWRGTSVIILAVSKDGVHFKRLGKVVLYPTLKEELRGGCEDPRIVEVNGTYYMTYAAYNGKVAKLALAISKDLIHWVKVRDSIP